MLNQDEGLKIISTIGQKGRLKSGFFELLPTEILAKIFKYLDEKEFRELSSVNRYSAFSFFGDPRHGIIKAKIFGKKQEIKKIYDKKIDDFLISTANSDDMIFMQLMGCSVGLALIVSNLIIKYTMDKKESAASVYLGISGALILLGITINFFIKKVHRAKIVYSIKNDMDKEISKEIAEFYEHLKLYEQPITLKEVVVHKNELNNQSDNESTGLLFTKSHDEEEKVAKYRSMTINR